MARKARVRAQSGVYHVVIQGVRHRDLFLDEEDYAQFTELLERTTKTEDEGLGTVVNYELIGYCLMSDHLHLLLKEGEEDVSKVVSRIVTPYSHYFNNKYDRDGAIYRARFASEPVEDAERQDIVLRYILQTPLRLKRVDSLDDYPYSSWHREPEERRQQLLVPLPAGTKCLSPRKNAPPRPSDKQVLLMIYQMTGASSISEFMLQPYANCLSTLTDLRRRGASVRQLERLTGIGRGVIQRL